MSIKTYHLDPDSELTPEQISMIERAAKKEPVFDEDSPELTDDQLAQFRKISEENRDRRRKQPVTLRLYPETIDKAKKLGKGYTGILSRIIESALNDPKILSKYL